MGSFKASCAVSALRALLHHSDHGDHLLVPDFKTCNGKGLQSSRFYLLSVQNFLVKVSGFQRSTLVHPSGPVVLPSSVCFVDHLLDMC